MRQAEVIVVGAGAAGIIASITAGRLGAKVLLVEKTDRVGTKILISGGGKCNVTHAGSIDSILRAFRVPEREFLRPALYAYPPQQIIETLKSHKIELAARPDGRYFPVDRTAKDVVRALHQEVLDAGVDVWQPVAIKRLLTENGAMVGVETRQGEHVASRHVIVSCGGASYPNSGTSGDAWPWLSELEHSIVPLRAALAPIELESPLALAGVAVRDCTLRARSGKELARWRGDLLFTHRGISGPCALGVSREVAECREAVELVVDLLPGVPYDQVSQDTISPIPASVLKELGLTWNDKKSRNRSAERVKNWSLGRVSHVPLEKGEVTAGGVALDEVEPTTMRSRLVEGLWLCGEVLDIAGPVGGYNLQAAWSMGYLAGKDAGTSALKNR